MTEWAWICPLNMWRWKVNIANHLSVCSVEVTERKNLSIFLRHGCLWICLIVCVCVVFFFRKVGAKGSGSRRSRRRRPVLTIAESCRGRAPSEPASVRMPCDLWKVNKGWSTAGLQENREQTRSNTLLLGAAEETEDTQPACEYAVDISPVQCEQTEGRNLPQFSFIFTQATTTVFHPCFNLHTRLFPNPLHPCLQILEQSQCLLQADSQSVSSVPESHRTMRTLQL